MARIPFTELAASLGCEPQLFGNYYLDKINEPIFQDYSLAEAGRIIDKYVKYIKAEAYKSILITYQHRTDDESEKIRAIALMESLRNKPLIDEEEAKEFYDRIEQCIDSKEQKKRLAGMVWPEDKSYDNSTERDDVEEIRALALQEHIRRKALMDVDEAKEYERQKNDILSIEIGEGFFKK